MAVIVSLPCRAEAGTARAQTRLLMWSPLMSSRTVNSIVPGNAWSPIDGDANVICFRPRGAASRRKVALRSCDMMDDSPVKDLREYEGAPESDDDYRYRMRSGRIEARIGLRMMPTFPRSPLSFRTASFPRYGWKAGFSDGAFLAFTRLSLLPTFATCWPVCIHPSYTS